MRDFIYSVMQDYSLFVIFFHVLGASVWVGGMITLWFLTRESGAGVPIDRRATGRAALYKKFFTFLSPFVLLLFIQNPYHEKHIHNHYCPDTSLGMDKLIGFQIF